MSSLDGCSKTVYRLPKKYRNCFFDTFKWDGKEKLREQLEAFATAVLEGKSPPPHLLMLGPQGRGKSHLGVAFYRWYVFHSDATKSYWLNVPDFCDKVKLKFNDNNFDGERFWKEIEDAEFLVLDDLTARDLTPWELENIIFRLINTSYNSGQVLIITDNKSIEQLAQVLRKHEMSRILEGAVALSFTSLPDYRLTHAD